MRVALHVWENWEWPANINTIPYLDTRVRSDDHTTTVHTSSRNSESERDSMVVSISDCHHPRPGQAFGQYQHPIIPAGNINDHLFALIIGIDQYQDKSIRNLKGCVKDSEDVCTFLTDSLHANPLHIKHLRDADATREGILSAIEKHLIENNDIQHNDAIVFYFAGHGSYEVAEEIAGGEVKMETICPHDDREGARGIPDRTFACLMRRLAALKGDNITAIFDSCHSGGMGRNPDSDSDGARSIAPPDSRFPLGLDKKIWRTEPGLPTEIEDPYLPYPPLKSHILLAGCQHDELAFESPPASGGKHAGAFTALLLDILRQPGRNLAETTYIGLFHTLEQMENKARLPKQTPYVEGYNKSRIIFHTRDPSRQFPVLLGENGVFSVAAGSIHGVNSETEFRITSGDTSFSSLKPFKVSPLSCNFRAIGATTLRDDSKAEVTKWVQPHVKVFFPDPPDRPPPTHEHYDVVISRLPNNVLELERRDELLPQYVKSVVSYTPLGTHEEGCARIMAGISHFNFFLLHQRGSFFELVGSDLSFKFERLRNDNGSYRPVEPRQDLFTFGERLNPRTQPQRTAPKVAGSLSLRESELKDIFGFTIGVSNILPSTPLFPYVFAFDALTYEVACFYHPEPSKFGPFSERQEVGVGYGRDGGDPFQFHANEVTFFKVFATSEYVDLMSLEQQSPFEGYAISRKSAQFSIPRDSWDSWTYVIGS